jgi:hypothetical protein
MTETPKPQASRLAVLSDGAPLDAEAARTLWTEFSAYMDENVGDMAGFAKKRGWQSVAPEFRDGKAVLIVLTGGPVVAPPRKPQAAPQQKPQPKPKPKPAQKAAPPRGKGGKGPGKPRR